MKRGEKRVWPLGRKKGSKKSGLIQVGVLAALGLAAVMSLILPQLMREKREPVLLPLSVVLRDTDSSGWSIARQGMEQAADELGAELRFLTLAEANDAPGQEALVLREIESGAAALVVVPADPETLQLALGKWLAVCPTVTLESPMEGAAGTVAPDNALLGQRLAQALLEDWDSGEVVLLESARGGVEERLAAAEATLAQAGVPTRREREAPAGPCRWVMAFEPPATRDAAAKKEAESREFALYGVGTATDITARLERGTIAAMAAWSDYAAGYLAVRRAVEAARGEGEAESAVALPFSILRGEDIYAPENQKLLFPVMSSSGR